MGNDPLFDLSGRVVIITGGHGRLGRRFTDALLERGAKVAVLDRVTLAADRLPEKATPENYLQLAVDITVREELEAALDGIQSKLGGPYGLINNAALDSPPDAPPSETGPFESYPKSSLDKVLEVNINGTVLCCQVFGAAMAEAKKGSIINIGSIYGVVSPDHRIYKYRLEDSPEPFFKPVAYSISKSALYNFTKYLAVYWAEAGVRANIVTLAGVFDEQDQRFLEGYEARMPMGRMAMPGEYDGLIVFLLSDASSYMTGSNVVMDGGWTAW